MSQATFTWNDSALQSYLVALERGTVSQNERLRHLLADQLVGFTKEHFQERGPGWAPKSPLFAYWEGKEAPLSYTRQLELSIEYAFVGRDTVQVGTNKPYAATQQYGTDGPRAVVFHIIPEYEPAKRNSAFNRGFTKYNVQGVRRTAKGGFRAKDYSIGRETQGLRIARFENGFPKGKLDPTRRDPRAIKVLMRINIVPRPFLREPDADETRRQEALVRDYIELIGGRAA